MLEAFRRQISKFQVTDVDKKELEQEAASVTLLKN